MAAQEAPKTEKKIPLGKLAPLSVAAVPAFVGLWAAMGPGGEC